MSFRMPINETPWDKDPSLALRMTKSARDDTEYPIILTERLFLGERYEKESSCHNNTCAFGG